MSIEHFKISTGLKNLIGSELITDNFIAVFELVKNSFDAKASEVKIIFKDFDSKTSPPSIIIQDNGKGMNYEDLINKWLFVAYSAKKDGTEDDDESNLKYKSKVTQQKFYAGAKGVGRFSCDRLGKCLKLISKKDEPNAKTEQLQINWSLFDYDSKQEFETIPVEHSTLEDSKFNLNHGTILEITDINIDEWNRDSFLKLKEKLSKLIRPDLNKNTKTQKFKIQLIVPSEQKQDEVEFENSKKLNEDEQEGYIYKNTVNGFIQNFLFEELDIKTTKLISEISPDGNQIKTQLIDRDNLIYEIVEKNPFNLLADTSITLYFLSRAAKIHFSKKMGLQPVDFGNLFIYKNGFRIYPYGERGDDSLGLDNRAMQGYARYIGLRNLIGQIDIQGQNKDLVETTSRAGGLVKTKAYQQLANLENGFIVTALKRLEKFVVDVTQWGINDEEFELNDKQQTKENLVKLISNIYDDKALISINYNKDLINILEQKEEKSAKKLVRNFKRLATETNNPTLLKDANKLENTILHQSKALVSATKEIASKSKENLELGEKLEEQIGETLFARAVVGTETKELLSIQHHIYRYSAQHISNFIDQLINAINNDAPKVKLLDIVNKIAFENKKIVTLSKFVNKANFNTTTNKINADLVMFVNEYVTNVYSEYKHLAVNNQLLNIKTDTPKGLTFPFTFKPIEIIIVLDNLLNNAFKAKAKNVLISWERKNESEVTLKVKDDGVGIPEKNLEKIFDFRFSTTDGSGLGLYHTREIIQKLGGSIEVNKNNKLGAEFIINLRK